MKKQIKKDKVVNIDRPKKKFPIKFIYHGRSIVINLNNNKPSITIDGEDIPVVRNPNGGFTAMKHNMMDPQQTLEGLAMNVTDHVINMRCDFPSIAILRNPTF